MNKNLLFSALSFAMIIPMTACASQLFKKSKPQQQPAVAQTAAEPAKAAEPVNVDFLEGEWVIKSVGKTDIDREENYPYINFVPAEDSFYASNGCNILNGIFTVEGDRITFHNVLSTMKYCADAPFDVLINAIIADEKPVTFMREVNDGETYLYFMNEQGQRLMTMHRPGLEFLNGNWEVTQINGEEFENAGMTIFFDVDERKVHGNTGCNSFNGEIYVDPQNVKKLSLSNMAVTMRMCPNIEQQSKFLVALEETTSAKPGENGEAYLLDNDGKTVMVLKALPVKRK